MIACTNLTFTYPDSPQLALDAVNLEIDPAEFVLVAGPSGAGKSTWLRCLNGLIPHFSGGSLSGSITVAGIDVVKAGPSVLSQHVGFVFQNPEAQAVLDRVEAEIAWALENAAIPAAEMRVRVEEVLDLLELTPMRDRLLTTLSGGERQRVAIACALALRPQVLVLDEPTSQLDPQSAENVLQTLVRLNEDLGLTIILAEHRLDRVLRYVDRVLYFADGRLTIDADTQTALAELPDVPPLVDLARQQEWQPLPLTVKDARTLVRKAKFSPAESTREVREVSAEILNLDQINHYYDRNQTLKNVSLSLHEGEIVTLLGRNGSGKSTLLKCIVGLQSAESGTVMLNGKTTAGRTVADICREVAWLPQNPDDLLFAETVRDELLITLKNHELPVDDVAVDALLDTLGLLSLADAYPRDLSVGQRQRVALASILVTQPHILLLDEPTRGLDMATKQRFADLLISWRDEGRAILVVTHDVELAALIADRVVVMAQGEIIAEGISAEILPSSPLFAPQIARLFPTSGHLTLADMVHDA